MIKEYLETLLKQPACFKIESDISDDGFFNKTEWILGFNELRIRLGDRKKEPILRKQFKEIRNQAVFREDSGTRDDSTVRVTRADLREYIQAQISTIQTSFAVNQVQSILDVLSRLRDYPVGYYRVQEQLDDGKWSPLDDMIGDSTVANKTSLDLRYIRTYIKHVGEFYVFTLAVAEKSGRYS